MEEKVSERKKEKERKRKEEEEEEWKRKRCLSEGKRRWQAWV